jgi:hypothetical protein
LNPCSSRTESVSHNSLRFCRTWCWFLDTSRQGGHSRLVSRLAHRFLKSGMRAGDRTGPLWQGFAGLCRGIAGILPTTQPLYLPLSLEVHLPTYLPTYYTTRLLQHPQGLMTISLLEEDLLNKNEKNSKTTRVLTSLHTQSFL